MSDLPLHGPRSRPAPVRLPPRPIPHVAVGDRRSACPAFVHHRLFPTRRDACELTIKREPLGKVSRHIHDHLHVGDRLRVTAPAGRFVFTGEESPAVLLIAGGVGSRP